MAAQLVFTARSEDGGGRVLASGSWTAGQLAPLERKIKLIEGQAGGLESVEIDVSEIRELDTFGAWLLERLVREVAPNARLVGLSPKFRGLLDEIHRCGRELPAPAGGNLLLFKLEALGRLAGEFVQDLVRLAEMLGSLGLALVRTIIHPKTFRFAASVHHIDRVGWQALPIIVLITLLIGGIIAQQGFFHFRKFGADDYVVDLIGVLVLREIGVLIVTIMVAGRSGSSYTAEIGSMKMREEIDALRTMGLDPVEVLMFPRVLALVLALPILAFLGSMAALYGGGMVAWFYGGMAPEIYIARLKEAITVTHFEVGMIKAPFMALVIGLVACSEGLQVAGSAESLGLKTTASVVKSIFLVIVLDGFFAIFFASIGM